MCDTLKVSRSGYYDWSNRKISKRKLYHLQLMNMIKQIHEESDGTYGGIRIQRKLLIHGYICDIKLIERLMKVCKISSKIKRKYTPSTTDSNHNYEVSPNILNREFIVTEPNKVWVSDITYIRVDKQWMYLCVIIDLFNREVLSWDLSRSLEAGSLIKVLNNAVMQHKPKPGLIFHSDRGIQYACNEFRRRLSLYKIIQSMSRVKNCWDNAVAESFFKALKVERVYHRKYMDEVQTKSDQFQYIEIFYNRKRLHSSLNYTNLVDYKKEYLKQIA